MLIPNLIFLLFILIKWIQRRKKLNPHRPLLFTITSLLVFLTVTIISRCVLTMIMPDQEISVKILWLIIHWMHLWTEFCVLLFGRLFIV